MKLKISWGTGIVIAFVLFIAFIMYFVVNMTTNKKYDHDFVTDNYYEKELAFQEAKTAIETTAEQGMSVKIEASEKGITLFFPEKITDDQAVKGWVSLYCPSDIKRDFRLPLQLKNSEMLIPISVLQSSRWNVEVNYLFEGKSYLSVKNIEFSK